MPMVVGIFPNTAALSKLSDSLKGAGLDLSRLVVISEEEPSEELIDNGVRFRLSGEPDTETLDSAEGHLTSSGGTEVPGLSSGAMPHLVGSDPNEELLSDLNVPDGRTDDYEAAIEAGRCIAGYPASDADAVKGLFVNAGGSPVEVF
ncbi:MAG: hypothetical protein JO219_04770 [Candidatus Eremiobacteraeota bacterium]|nr:hypothetical protein [Candidatus Eremiobacteraeota bacterium]